MVKELINNQIKKIEFREKKIFWVLFSTFVFFTVSYGFLLVSIMTNGVAKQNMDHEMIALGSDVNSLEFEYLNIKNSITIDLAKSRGFVSVAADKFAVAGSLKTNLSLSINEN